MNLVALALLTASLSAAPSESSSYYWHGQKIPVLRSRVYLAVEVQPAQAVDAEKVIRRAGAKVAKRLTPAGRAILVVDVRALELGQRRALARDLEAQRGFVAMLEPARTKGFAEDDLKEVFDRHVLVRFEDGVSPSQVAALGRDLGFSVAQRYSYAPAAYRLQARDASAALAVSLALVERGLARYAEPDRFVRPVLYQATDTYYAKEWHLKSANGSDINAEPAWAVTMGAASTIVAVADTGLDTTHPEFSAVGKVVHPLDVYDGDTDVRPPPADPNDPMSGVLGAHGTGASGLAVSPADGAGVVGSCPDCSLMPIRLGPGSGMWSLGTLVTAFDHVRTNGAKVMSNSWGLGPIYLPQACLDAMEAAIAAGVSVLFASGNGAGYMAPRDFAAHPDVIAIGGSSIESKHVSYSDKGPGLDLVAPTMEVAAGMAGQLGCAQGGVGMVTTDLVGSDGMNTTLDGVMDLCSLLGVPATCTATVDYTCYFSGTSAATPVAAGAVGVLVTAQPTLTPTLVKWALAQSADKIGAAAYDAQGWNEEMGFGRVNLGAAVALAQAGPLCVPQAEDCQNGADDDCDLAVDSADTDCGAAFPPPLDASEWGATCTPSGYGEDEASCGTDLGCLTVGAPSTIPGMGGKGFCTTLCEEQCPAGFACVAVPDPASGVESGFCAKACTSPADCPAGFVCATSSLAADPQAGQCLPSCQSADKDCPAGMQCTAVKACAADAIVGAGLDGGVAPADASGQQPDATHEPADASVEPGDAEVFQGDAEVSQGDAEVFQGDAEVVSAGDGSIVASADGSVIVSADGSIVAVVDGSIAAADAGPASAPDAGGTGFADAGAPPPAAQSCGCGTTSSPASGLAFAMVFGLWLARRRAEPRLRGASRRVRSESPLEASAPPPSRPASVPPSWTD